MLDAAAGVAYALDPSLLMAKSGLTPDGWQRDLLRSDARRTLVLAARQVGKSTTAAHIALAEALFKPQSLTLCVSPSLRQSSELFRRVVDGFQHVSDLAGVVAESALRIEFANGSRVISLPGSEGTVRGYSGVTLLLLDEAARIPDSLLGAVRPMLATTNGRILALSTGWLRTGWFYDAWMGAGRDGEAWERVEITADQCPRISAEFLAEERSALGNLVFAAEYSCSFVDETGCFFDPQAIARAFRHDISPLFPGDAGLDFFIVRDPAKPPSPRRFVVGLDPASRVDYAGVVVDEPEGSGKTMTHTVRHVERWRGLSYPLLAERLRILTGRLNGSVTVVVDQTGVGVAVMDYLRDSQLGARLVGVTFTGGHETRSEGNAHRVPKRELLGGLGLALETNRLRLSKTMRHADTMQREMESFQQSLTDSGRDSYSAPSGQHDDLVSALSLSTWLAQREGSGGWQFEAGGSRYGMALRRSY